MKDSPLVSKTAALGLANDWATSGKAIAWIDAKLDAGEDVVSDAIRALPALVSNRRRLLADLKVVVAKEEDPLTDFREGDESGGEVATVEKEELLG